MRREDWRKLETTSPPESLNRSLIQNIDGKRYPRRQRLDEDETRALLFYCHVFRLLKTNYLQRC